MMHNISTIVIGLEDKAWTFIYHQYRLELSIKEYSIMNL